MRRSIIKTWIVRRRTTWLAFASLIGAAIWLVEIIDDRRAPQIAARLLRMPHLPASLRNVRCESEWIPTDAVTTCVFEIAPADFPALLKGWPFEESGVSGGSHRYVVGPKVGPGFDAAVLFQYNETIRPFRLFEHGGWVTLVADATRSRGQVSLYEE
jgi:hypothetical protein